MACCVNAKEENGKFMSSGNLDKEAGVTCGYCVRGKASLCNKRNKYDDETGSALALTSLETSWRDHAVSPQKDWPCCV
eukprot:1342078-Amphidinium_carterae.1